MWTLPAQQDEQQTVADDPWGDPLRPSDRACCCPAPAVFRVVLPANAGRPQATDLLLCCHHYRASLVALSHAHAAVYDGSGAQLDDWA